MDLWFEHHPDYFHKPPKLCCYQIKALYIMFSVAILEFLSILCCPIIGVVVMWVIWMSVLTILIRFWYLSMSAHVENFLKALQSIKTCESHFEISLLGMFIVTYRYILFKSSQKLHHVWIITSFSKFSRIFLEFWRISIANCNMLCHKCI